MCVEKRHTLSLLARALKSFVTDLYLNSFDIYSICFKFCTR